MMENNSYLMKKNRFKKKKNGKNRKVAFWKYFLPAFLFIIILVLAFFWKKNTNTKINPDYENRAEVDANDIRNIMEKEFIYPVEKKYIPGGENILQYCILDTKPILELFTDLNKILEMKKINVINVEERENNYYHKVVISIKGKEGKIELHILSKDSENIVSQNNGEYKKIAIVIDDFGYSEKYVERFHKLKIPITYAIIPHLQYSKKIASQVNLEKNNVIVHIPMEAETKEIILEDTSIFMKDRKEEFMKKLQGYFQELPMAIGGNNHMGSLVMKDKNRMLWLIGFMKDKNYVFLDSRTTSETEAPYAARYLGYEIKERNFYLDNEDGKEYIINQLNLLIEMAQNKGNAIAIGHVRKGTIEALEDFFSEEKLKELAGMKIKFCKIEEM